ncbi:MULTISPECIES: CU044_5270 family protein [Actinomadura]|uniref:CU044_5270 family protein n=1 Tax=Actinomadura yumaensis TaxID=111807 RepID=A0ABW2CEY8_9ACTN|nr:CU044_5270 family protein [Actinomadura sp. J1-007]MWK35556.1 hypothetical protein [Actinomadura sp. J1-007]
MDELKLMEDFVRDVAEPDSASLAQGRARLLADMDGGADQETRAFSRRASSRPAFPRRRFSRPVVRTVAVGTLAAAIAAGVTVVQSVGGDTSPGGVVPAGPVANAQELATRARTAARSQPDTPLAPGQWIYVKTLTAEIDGRVLGPRTKRTVDERWLTVDGRTPPRKDRAIVPLTEPTAKALIGMPADPDAALARLYAEVHRIRRLAAHPPAGRGPVGFSVRNDVLGAPRGIAAFNLVSALLESYYVPPRLQATLYGALSRMPGVRTLPDSVDAQGRHGLALYVMSEGYIRQELILDRTTYRYLGGRSITVADHTVPAPPADVETDSRTPIHIKKGSVIGWSALLASAPVSGPHIRP